MITLRIFFPARRLVASTRLLGTRQGQLGSPRTDASPRRAPRRVKPASRVNRGESHTYDRRAAVTDQKMGSKQQVPDGMLIGPKNPIIEEALGDRLIGTSTCACAAKLGAGSRC